ncbi:eukaryotic translation initiation factor 4E-like [Contarinia nasturtii]|uniref:eukaryotic translation initiation factor 4E-like n=1 Tax=Contarinia nasturtii TaxID=265458 RepID=UPI0012D3FC2E|nr:eukaryotic translation initiation factor 4E-like [Contarinia nasturtii]
MSERNQRRRGLDENGNHSYIDDMATIKHPLNSKWTLWYYLPDDKKTWEENQNKIHTVTTIEDFWSFITHIKQPSELIGGVDYSFFKNNIRPMWESPQNVNGGRLTVTNTSKTRNDPRAAGINDIWLDVLLFLIGENFEYTDDVCGVVLNVRKYGFKIAVWTSHHEENKIRAIGNSIKKSLSHKSPFLQKITFEVHAETQRNAQTTGRASSKNLFEI